MALQFISDQVQNMFVSMLRPTRTCAYEYAYVVRFDPFTVATVGRLGMCEVDPGTSAAPSQGGTKRARPCPGGAVS